MIIDKEPILRQLLRTMAKTCPNVPPVAAPT